MHPLALSLTLALAPATSDIAAPLPPSEIIGGELVVAGEYDEVVAIHAGAYLCSGTRVAPGLVLTAAHCLVGLDLDDVEVSTGLDARVGERQPATELGTHPEFCAECGEDEFDYGYVKVEAGSLGTDALAIPIFDQSEWDEAVRRGASITIVGYGEDPGADAPARTKRKVTVELGKASASGQEFAAGGEFRDSCRGDSGGPAFVELPDGTRRQLGITSRGSLPCGKGGLYSTPYPALGWLRDRTGVDLCGPGCSTCDCLDITPPPSDAGCGCTARVTDPERPWVLALVLGVFVRRRRAG